MRWQASVATKSEAEVIAMQSRRPPDNGLFNRIFGTVAPGTEVDDRLIAGPAGDGVSGECVPRLGGSG